VASKLPALALRLAGIAVLLLQAGLFARARFAAPQLVHVTPCEGGTHYRLFAQVGEASLSNREARARYGLPRTGWVVHTPEGLRTIVRAAERARAGGPAAVVRLHTRHNGEREEVWLWPEN
jgi:hypothetical protein